VPLPILAGRLSAVPANLDDLKGLPVFVICKDGYRSPHAARLFGRRALPTWRS
jgi:rhodanese-related sulfurtransferase